MTTNQDSPWKEVRRVTAMLDPCVTREGLSVKSLGHRTMPLKVSFCIVGAIEKPVDVNLPRNGRSSRARLTDTFEAASGFP